MKQKNRILISGYYGFDNSGDDAILKAIVKDIKACDPNIDIIVLSKNPSNTENIYGIKALNRFRFKNVIKGIKECDLFISGGGSLLQDVTSTRSLIYYLALMKIALHFKKPVMVYANGIGPIDKKFNRFLTRKILNKVDLITLRDKDSKEFVEYLGVKNSNIYVTADPVFTLEPTKRENTIEILKIEGIPLDRPLIGVSVREWKDDESLVSIMAKAIEYIIDKYSVNVILIPMHYPEDLAISNEIKDRVDRRDCFVISNKYDVEDIMGIIKELELILAMRLHSLIYAATQGVPMIGLIYDPKIEGFLKLIEMKYMSHVESLRYDELCKNIDGAWQNREDMKVKLKKYDHELKVKALKNVDKALTLLEK